MKRRRIVIWTTVILIVVLAGFFALREMGKAAFPRDELDPATYGKVLKDLGYPSPTLAHFPATIPAQANNVRFYHQVGVLQAGTEVQLRCSLANADVATIEQTARAAAVSIYHGGDKFDAHNIGRGLPATTFRNALNAGDAPLPATFEVFVLGAVTTMDWNHGQTHGIAIDKSSGEVIWWFDQW